MTEHGPKRGSRSSLPTWIPSSFRSSCLKLIDELLAGAWTPEEITGSDGLLSRLTKRLVEREMEAELSEHLGYERGQAPPRDNRYTGRPAAERAQKSRSPVTFRSSGFD